MELTITREGPSHPDDPVKLEVSGSVDLSTRHVLIDAANSALLVSKALTIDASNVDFIDSSGIEALNEITAMAERQQATVALGRRSPAVERVLELLDLEPAWAVAASSRSRNPIGSTT